MLHHRLFRYETLLRVRKIREDQQAQRLAEVRHAIARAEQELRSLQDEQARVFADVAQSARDHFDAADIQYLYNYERFLARRAVECDARIASLRRLERERLAELETANRRKRVVERLKERHLSLFRSEWNAFEQKIADEVALRKRGENQNIHTNEA